VDVKRRRVEAIRMPVVGDGTDFQRVAEIIRTRCRRQFSHWEKRKLVCVSQMAPRLDHNETASMTGKENRKRVSATRVTRPIIFTILGVVPGAEGGFRSRRRSKNGSDTRGHHGLGLWDAGYGSGIPKVVRDTVRLNGERHTVIG